MRYTIRFFSSSGVKRWCDERAERCRIAWAHPDERTGNGFTPEPVMRVFWELHNGDEHPLGLFSPDCLLEACWTRPGWDDWFRSFQEQQRRAEERRIVNQFWVTGIDAIHCAALINESGRLLTVGAEENKDVQHKIDLIVIGKDEREHRVALYADSPRNQFWLEYKARKRGGPPPGTIHLPLPCMDGTRRRGEPCNKAWYRQEDLQPLFHALGDGILL